MSKCNNCPYSSFGSKDGLSDICDECEYYYDNYDEYDDEYDDDDYGRFDSDDDEMRDFIEKNKKNKIVIPISEEKKKEFCDLLSKSCNFSFSFEDDLL